GAILVFEPGTLPGVSFSGSGVTDLRTLTVSKGPGVTLNVSLSQLTVRGSGTDVSGFLSLTSGILKFSGPFTLTSPLFQIPAYTIDGESQLWLAAPNLTVTGLAGSPTLLGTLRVSAGTLNVGTAAGHSLQLGNGSTLWI